MKNFKGEILGALVVGTIVSAIVLFLLKMYIFSIILTFIFLAIFYRFGPMVFFINTTFTEKFAFSLIFFGFVVGIAFIIYSDFFFGDPLFSPLGFKMTIGSLLLVLISVFTGVIKD